MTTQDTMRLALEWIEDAVVVLSRTSSAIQGGIGAEAEGVGGCSVQVIKALREALAQQGEPVLPMDTAPENGTIVQLLVDFEGNSLEDTDKPVWTIGACYAADAEGAVWQFAGWNWEHDCFTEGHGKPIGWRPMNGEAAPAAQQGESAIANSLNEMSLATIQTLQGVSDEYNAWIRFQAAGTGDYDDFLKQYGAFK